MQKGGARYKQLWVKSSGLVKPFFFFFLPCPLGLKSLCFLSLDQTKVTDAGMVLYLHSAPSCLSQLSLNGTAVTEATLVVLPGCAPQLRLLSIKQTKVRFPKIRLLPSGCHGDAALSGQGRGGSGQAVRPADSQPGRDRSVRKRSAAPRLPPASVLPQLSGNLCR